MSSGKSIIYVRVSTSDQAERGVSLDNQERACNDWAFRNRIQNLKTFREEGVSAKDLNRPALKEMFDYIKIYGNEIDFLIVYQIDRLSRNMSDFVKLGATLGSFNIELRDSSSHIESNESTELVQGINALMAQHDNRLKSRRVKDVMSRYAQEGYRMHQAPYGLHNVRDALGRPSVAPLEPTASKIAELLCSFSSGAYTRGRLLKLAKEIGLKQPNQKEMGFQFLDKLLRQPLYAGLEKSSLTNDELVPSVFEGIVDKSVYYKNQSILDKDIQNLRDGYRINHPDFPLRRFVKCSKCKGLLRGSSPTGRGGKKYPRYHCTSPGCHSAYIKPDKLHSLFVGYLQSASPDSQRVKLLKELIVRIWKEESSSAITKKDSIQTKISSLQQKKILATEKLINGDISVEDKTEFSRKIDNQIDQLKLHESKLNQTIGTKENVIDYALNFITNAGKIWYDSDLNTKIVFQNLILPEGISFDLDKREFGTASKSVLYRFVNEANQSKSFDESLLVVPRGFEPLLPP